MMQSLKRLITLTLSCVLMLHAAPLSSAVNKDSELQTATAYIREQKIMVGDQNGNMNLEQGLTRAELAVILTRIAGNIDHVHIDSEYYKSRCKFTDVPDWAKVYVGYCYSVGLVAGYDNTRYGAMDNVTPAAACTVILQFLEYPKTEWSYQTACCKLAELGFCAQLSLNQDEISRGDMILLLYRALGSPADPKNTSPAVSSGSTPYIPTVGDQILCDDGSIYTVTDVSRYDSNVFASGPVGDLPGPTCDWNRFPALDLPNADVRRFQNKNRDGLFVRNLFETRRMVYTIYNALGEKPKAWKNNLPLATVTPYIPAELELYSASFWPWRASELTDLVHSRPNSQFYVEAWDYYLNGVFQYTRYCAVSL